VAKTKKKKKASLPCPCRETNLGRVARNAITILTELPRHPSYKKVQ